MKNLKIKENVGLISSPRRPISNLSFHHNDPSRIENITELKSNGNNFLTMINRLENLNKKSNNNNNNNNQEARNILTLLKNKVDRIGNHTNNNHNNNASKTTEIILTPRSKSNIKAHNESLLPSTIKIYIKNENQINNYFCKEGFKEPVIMSSSKYSTTFRENLNTENLNKDKTSLNKNNNSKIEGLVKVFSERYSKNGTNMLSKVYTSHQDQSTPTASRSNSLKTYLNNNEDSVPNYAKLILSNKNKDFIKEKVLPSYFNPQNTEIKKNISHRRKSDTKDSSKEYTSYNTLINEITNKNEETSNSSDRLKPNLPLKRPSSSLTRRSPSPTKPAPPREPSPPPSPPSPSNKSKIAQLRNLYNGTPIKNTNNDNGLKRKEAIRRPKIAPKLLENKMVQTDLNPENIITDLKPQTSKLIEKINLNLNSNTSKTTSSLSAAKQKNLPKLKLSSDQHSNNKKLQDSSNFSLIKCMNSNELGNYIDNVIQNFRKRTILNESIIENRELATNTFYPENDDYTIISEQASSKVIMNERRRLSETKSSSSSTKQLASSITNRKIVNRPASPVPIKLQPITKPPKPPQIINSSSKNYYGHTRNLTNYKNIPSNDTEIVIESNNDDAIMITAMMVESRTLTNLSQQEEPKKTSKNVDDKHDEESFINFTHSIEVEDSVARFAAAEMDKHQNKNKFDLSSDSYDEDEEYEDGDEDADETERGADSDIGDDGDDEMYADNEIRRLEERNSEQLKESSYINSEQFDRSAK
jgi:hypothetical protein